MQFPTGGKAHEPQGMIRCNSEADSIVWMKEDENAEQKTVMRLWKLLWDVFTFRSFVFTQGYLYQRVKKVFSLR